jgi:hypothetical protein
VLGADSIRQALGKHRPGWGQDDASKRGRGCQSGEQRRSKRAKIHFILLGLSEAVEDRTHAGHFSQWLSLPPSFLPIVQAAAPAFDIVGLSSGGMGYAAFLPAWPGLGHGVSYTVGAV